MKTKSNAPEMGEAGSNPAKQETVLTAVVQSIEDKIQYYQRKQVLISRFHGLENTQNTISEHQANIQKEAGEDVFMSDQYKLTLSVKSGYSSERDLLTFRNPEILGEMLAFVQARIKIKLDQVSREIAE